MCASLQQATPTVDARSGHGFHISHVSACLTVLYQDPDSLHSGLKGSFHAWNSSCLKPASLRRIVMLKAQTKGKECRFFHTTLYLHWHLLYFWKGGNAVRLCWTVGMLNDAINRRDFKNSLWYKLLCSNWPLKFKLKPWDSFYQHVLYSMSFISR